MIANVNTPATVVNTLIPISRSTYISAMQNSLVSSRYALQTELAICLAIFSESSRVDRESKKAAQEVYVAAGWDAADQYCPEYKTALRRIQIASILYTHIGSDVISAWTAGAVEMMIITSIVDHLAPYNLRSMDAVLSYCGRQRIPKAPTNTPLQQKAQQGSEMELRGTVDDQSESIPEPLPTDDKEGMLYQQWLAQRGNTPERNARELEQGYHQVKTEHILVSIPPEAPKDEIIRAAMAMLAYASEMVGAETSTEASADEDLQTPLKAALQEAIAKQKQEEDEADEDAASIIEHQRIEQERMEAEKREAKKPTRRITKR